MAFASNIDDIFILMLYSSNKKFVTKQADLYQYLGINGLTFVSFIATRELFVLLYRQISKLHC